MKPGPSNLSKRSCSKRKKISLGSKFHFWGVLRLEFDKTTSIFEINNFEFEKLQSFCKKPFKSRTKIVYFGVLAWKLKKTFVIFKISTFKFVIKNTLFGYFGVRM